MLCSLAFSTWVQAKLLRMTPEARQKYEEKMQRQNAKKAMKTKAVRI
jgi:hypothetical protein